MCENIVEKSATVKKELISSAIKLTANANHNNKNKKNNNKNILNKNNNNTNNSCCNSVSGTTLSLFDQLKYSVSHNLCMTDRTANNKNGHKVKTLLSHNNNEIQPQQHSNNINNNVRIQEIYHGRLLQKSLTITEQQHQQQQQKQLNANDVVDDADTDTDFDTDIDADIEEKLVMNMDRMENQEDLLKNLNNKQHIETSDIVVEECNDLTSSSMASSISATTAPLQIALDSTSSHSTNTNTTTTNIIEEEEEEEEEINEVDTEDEEEEQQVKRTVKNIKLSISDKKQQQQHTGTIACQTQPLTFLSNPSNKITVNKTSSTIASLNLSSIGNFFTTDVCKTGSGLKREHLMKTAGNSKNLQQQQQEPKLMMPITTTTTSITPLLGIVHGTKRATMTPAAIQQKQQQQKQQLNTRSVTSTNSLAHSSATSTAPTTTTTATIPTISTFIDMQQQQQQQTTTTTSRNRKSMKNLTNEINTTTRTTLQMPSEQKQQHQVLNTPTHFQLNNNNNNINTTKKIQKSVLDFGRLSIKHENNCKLDNNNRNDKRKRCNDRYDSSESSDR